MSHVPDWRHTLAVSVLMHVLLAISLIYAPRTPDSQVPTVDSVLAVYTLPQPISEQATEPAPRKADDAPKPTAQTVTPALAADQHIKRHRQPKSEPHASAAAQAKEAPAEPQADPFATRVVARKREPKPSPSDSGLSDAYKALIAQAIRARLESNQDDSPTDGALLNLDIDPESGRVLRARIQRTSGQMRWDTRSQHAALNTTIPSPSSGHRPSTLTVYIHP